MKQEKNHRSPGRPRSEDLKKSTLDSIVQIATGMFLQLGYEGVSMESVARECSVTKPTIYYYFDNKSELFLASLLKMLIVMEASIKDFLKKNDPLHTLLIKLAEAHLAPTHHMDLEGLIKQAENHIPSHRMRDLREGMESMILSVADAFSNAIERKEIRAVDPIIAAYTYNSLLLLGNTKRPDGTSLFSTPNEAAKHIVTLLWEGLRLPIETVNIQNGQQS
jgi:AcrR family transcriptional regulator